MREDARREDARREQFLSQPRGLSSPVVWMTEQMLPMRVCERVCVREMAGHMLRANSNGWSSCLNGEAKKPTLVRGGQLKPDILSIKHEYRLTKLGISAPEKLKHEHLTHTEL